LIESSFCRKSWNAPWSCIIHELEREAKVVSSVVQMSWEVLQSITRCRTSVESKDKRALMIKWSCCFHDKYEGLIDGKDVAVDIRWEGGHGEVPSTKKCMPWPKRKGFICILRYKKLVLESCKEITCWVLGRGMMKILFMISREEFRGTMLAVAAAKEDWEIGAAATTPCWSSWLSIVKRKGKANRSGRDNQK